MQKRKRHTYTHTRRFTIALILTMGFMLYLIVYNPYPIIAIPPYFEFLPFMYVPLTLWWLPLGLRYLRRFQVQKRIVLLMTVCCLMSLTLISIYEASQYNKWIHCQETTYGYDCEHTTFYRAGYCFRSFDIMTLPGFSVGILSVPFDAIESDCYAD
ncbi:MAG: hypothetical protein ACPG7F_20370 [Aggregatilineales bacterium]